MGGDEDDMARISMILVFYLVFMILVPYFFKGPDRLNEMPPNLSNPFGTDELGRDVLNLIWKGSLSLTIFSIAISSLALVSASFTVFFSTFNEKFDSILSAIEGVVLGFPILVTAMIVIGSIFEDIDSRRIAIFFLTLIVSWVIGSKSLRGRFEDIRNSTYVMSAVALGRCKISIFLFHFIPNSIENLVSTFFDVLRFSIFLHITLGFLGFGVPDSLGEQMGLNFLRTIGNLKLFDVFKVISAPFIPMLVKLGVLRFEPSWMNEWAFLAPLGYSIWILFSFYALRKSLEKIL